MSRLLAFILRWQEKTLVLPLMLVLGIAGWVVLGALDRTAATDVINLWIILPAKCAYVVAALAFTNLARRRWRKKLTEDEQNEWWAELIDGSTGAAIVYVTDAVFTLITLWLLLRVLQP